MLDSPLDNPLLGTDLTDPLVNQLAQDETVGDTYLVVPFNTKGGANNPFSRYGRVPAPIEVNEAELNQMWEDSGQLQDQFESIDNWKQFLIDTRPMVEDASWWDAEVTYAPDSKEFAAQFGDDFYQWSPGEKEETLDKIARDQASAREYEYIQWMQDHSGTLQLYGIQPVIYNDDGDQFRWTGSGYQKTIKIDDHADFGDYMEVIIKSALKSAVTAGVMSLAGAAVNSLNLTDAVGKATQAVKDALGAVLDGISNIPVVGDYIQTAGDKFLEFIFPTMKEGGFLGTGATSDPFGFLGSGAATVPGSMSKAGVEAMAAYEAAVANQNLPWILNLTKGLTDSIGEIRGLNDNAPENEKLYGSYELPDGFIYDDVKEAVIEVATGEEYPVQYTLYGSQKSPYNWIVYLPVDAEDGGGGGGGSESSSSDSSSESDSESDSESVASSVSASDAWIDAKANAAKAGLEGNEATQAAIKEWLESGYTIQDWYDIIGGGETSLYDTTWVDSEGQYEVIGQTEDGRWVVKDKADGDEWVIGGAWAVGAILTADDLMDNDARVWSGDLDTTGTNSPADPADPADPNDPTDPTDPVNPYEGIADGTVCDLPDGTKGEVKNEQCVAVSANPNPYAGMPDGTACQLANGVAGVVLAEQCVAKEPNPTSNVGNPCNPKLLMALSKKEPIQKDANGNEYCDISTSTSNNGTNPTSNVGNPCTTGC